jgi:hypothetical protein
VTGRLLVNPSFDGRLVLFARYRMADERRAPWLLEQTNPDDDWTGRSLGQQPISSLPPDQIGVPVLAMDGESRQLLVYPVRTAACTGFARPARPARSGWRGSTATSHRRRPSCIGTWSSGWSSCSVQKNGIVSRPACGRLRDERAPGLALLRPRRAIGGGVVTASFDAGARETTPPAGPAASTATRVRAARGVVVVAALVIVNVQPAGCPTATGGSTCCPVPAWRTGSS